MRAWRVYWTMHKLGVRARAAYRVDFALAIATAVATQLAALSLYWAVSEQSPAIGGWSRDEVLLLFGLTGLVLGCSELAVNGIWLVPSYIFRGDLDRFLLFPLRSLPLLLMARPEPHAFGNIGTSLALLLLAGQRLNIPLQAWAPLPLWVACGVAIYTSALVAVASLYMGVTTGPFADLLLPVHQLLGAARYPISIYPGWLRALLMGIFPIGTAIFLPAEWLSGKGSLWGATAAPLIVAAVCVSLVSVVWEQALLRYQSTGA